MFSMLNKLNTKNKASDALRDFCADGILSAKVIEQDNYSSAKRPSFEETLRVNGLNL